MNFPDLLSTITAMNRLKLKSSSLGLLTIQGRGSSGLLSSIVSSTMISKMQDLSMKRGKRELMQTREKWRFLEGLSSSTIWSSFSAWGSMDKRIQLLNLISMQASPCWGQNHISSTRVSKNITLHWSTVILISGIMATFMLRQRITSCISILAKKRLRNSKRFMAYDIYYLTGVRKIFLAPFFILEIA